jgi:hypothetical protein
MQLWFTRYYAFFLHGMREMNTCLCLRLSTSFSQGAAERVFMKFYIQEFEQFRTCLRQFS